MHNQVLVIYPRDVKLEDVMYPYQEINETIDDAINDERCQFILTVPEKKIPLLVDSIQRYLMETSNKYLEKLQYRSKYGYDEFKEKYKESPKGLLDSYIFFTSNLNDFIKIKDLPNDNPVKINFLKEFGYWATDWATDIYIKDIGYGMFHNPYQIWDYYAVVNERRFPRDVKFLIASDGNEYNKCLLLDVLDIDLTIENIKKLTRVCEYIIFCENDPDDSRLYTVDTIRFGYDWNKHCLVDNLEGVLRSIQEDYKNKDYVVTALDFHW